MRDEHVAVVFLRHLYALGKGRPRQHITSARNIVLHEALKRGAALLRRKRIKICALHAAHYDLQACRVEVIVKAGELHGRAVYIRRGQHRLFIVRRGVQRVELMLLNYRFQLDCRYFVRTARSSCTLIYILLILNTFAAFGNNFLFFYTHPGVNPAAPPGR